MADEKEKIVTTDLDQHTNQDCRFFLIFSVISVWLSEGMRYVTSANVLFKQSCNSMSNNLHNLSCSLHSTLNVINVGFLKNTLARDVIHDLQSEESCGAISICFSIRMAQNHLNKPQ